MENFVLFMLGLITGSFLNVVIYRLPKNESIISPASHCLECGTRLKPFDLVPVFSYLIYRGRCRYCDTKISWQYPGIELLTALLFLLTYFKFGLSIKLAVYLILISFLMVCSVIDLKYKIIPNKLTYSGIIIGLILSLFFNHISFLSSLVGALIPAALLLLIAIIYKKGMGIGDVKLVAMIGVFIGWQYTLLGIFLGSLIGSIMGLILILIGKLTRKTRIPFAPLISFGIIVFLLLDNQLINLYLKIFT